MIRILVHNKAGESRLIKVTEEIYKIVERKVIEKLNSNTDLQILLKNLNITKAKLMQSHITEEIVSEAITESTNNLKNKKP